MNAFSGFLIYKFKNKKKLLIGIYLIMGISFTVGIFTLSS